MDRNSYSFLGYYLILNCQNSKNRNYAKPTLPNMGEPKFERASFKSIVGIAHYLNSRIRGWVHYYGRFRRSELSKVFCPLRIRLMKWARKRCKRYRTRLNKAYQWLDTQRMIDYLIGKTKCFQEFDEKLNERPRKVVNLIFREGIEGFKGSLSAINYIKITGTTASTATRDLKKKWLI